MAEVKNKAETAQVIAKITDVTGIKLSKLTAIQIDTAVVFLVKDLCDGLGIKDEDKALKRVPDDERYKMKSDVTGKKPVWWVTIGGLYAIILYAPTKDENVLRYRKRVVTDIVNLNHRDLCKAVKAKVTMPIINRFL